MLILPILLLPLLSSCSKGARKGEKDAASRGKMKEGKKGQEAASVNTQKEPSSEEKHKEENVSKDKKEGEGVVERKLIREGFLKYEVDSVAREEERVQKMVQELDGYLADQKLRREYERKVMELTLRVPAENFQTLVERISKGVDGLDDQKIKVDDVTRKFIDLKARLKTKKELEARYKDLLGRTDSVDEIIRIEREIQKLREKIESIEGKLRYLKDRVAMSTLELEFYKTMEREEDNVGFMFWSKIISAAHAGWRGVQWFLILLVSIWPILLLGGIGTIIGVRIHRRQKKG
ncbi:MAG: DUF4349 domain-containing protein [Flavobacteriales bacterium]